VDASPSKNGLRIQDAFTKKALLSVGETFDVGDVTFRVVSATVSSKSPVVGIGRVPRRLPLQLIAMAVGTPLAITGLVVGLVAWSVGSDSESKVPRAWSQSEFADTIESKSNGKVTFSQDLPIAYFDLIPVYPNAELVGVYRFSNEENSVQAIWSTSHAIGEVEDFYRTQLTEVVSRNWSESTSEFARQLGQRTFTSTGNANLIVLVSAGEFTFIEATVHE
jgi:hypothetical protein